VREEETLVLLVDSGDFAGMRSGQGRIQAEIILEAMMKMGYHAATLGERELQQGRAFVDSLLRTVSFPLLAANLSDPATGERLTKTYEIVDLGTTRVGLIGLIMKLTPGVIDTTEFRIEDPIQWAKQLVPELQKDCDYVVALAHLGWGGSFALAQQVEGIDVVVAGHGSHASMEPQRVGPTLLVQSGNQGKYAGFLKVSGDVRKGKYEGSLIRLDTRFPDDSEMKELTSHYSTRVQNYYSNRQSETVLAPRTTQLSYKFTGVQQCQGCHTELYTRWLDTPHAHAMASLVEKGTQSESGCVRCHSTGYKRPSGFVSLTVTPDLANVQCEQCHGPGALHALYQKTGDAGIADMGITAVELAKNYGNVSPSVCLKCHTPERDDDFSYQRGDLTGIH
jgi:hypothetical protein